MEKELARYVKMKYHLTEAQIDAMTEDEYNSLCEDAIAQLWRTEADLQRLYRIWQSEQDFVDYLMSHRP